MERRHFEKRAVAPDDDDRRALGQIGAGGEPGGVANPDLAASIDDALFNDSGLADWTETKRILELPRQKPAV